MPKNNENDDTLTKTKQKRPKNNHQKYSPHTVAFFDHIDSRPFRFVTLSVVFSQLKSESNQIERQYLSIINGCG